MPKGIYPRRPRAPKTYPAQMVATVERLYTTGMTQDEIAAALGLTQRVIWRLMRHHGINARPAVIRHSKTGSNHHFWKGDRASYKAFHLRLYAERGAPRECEQCGTSDPRRRYDWANLTGRYEDTGDYSRMCRQCHRQYDKQRRGHTPGERLDITRAIVAGLREQGLSINEIARRLDTSWPTVRDRL